MTTPPALRRKCGICHLLMYALPTWVFYCKTCDMIPEPKP